jgi:SlyX protein
MPNHLPTLEAVMSQDLENAMIDMQVKIAYQDDVIEGLNNQIALLTSDMASLQKQMQYVMKSVRSISDMQGDGPVADAPPPHY